MLTPETPGIATLKFWPYEPPEAPEGLATVAPKALRPWPSVGLAHYYYRYAYDPTHYPEHQPGHHPRERLGRIDRIWGLILGGVGGLSPIAFPSVLVDQEY